MLCNAISFCVISQILTESIINITRLTFDTVTVINNDLLLSFALYSSAESLFSARMLFMGWLGNRSGYYN